MNSKISKILFLIFILASSIAIASVSDSTYILESERTLSPENTSYFIDPINGNDDNLGTEKSLAWKGFHNLNKLILTKGNRVEVISNSNFYESLFLIAKGTEELPVEVNFTEGRYDFFPENAYRAKFNISNTNDDANGMKSVAIYILNSKNICIDGGDAEIVFRGKVIETCIHNSENITIKNLSFDYFRPTVSEFTVTKLSSGYAEIRIQKDSKYKITAGKLTWLGEGWEYDFQKYCQEFNPINGTVYRTNISPRGLTFTEISENIVGVDFLVNPGLKEGMVYQNRNTFRDYSGVFMQNSKNISWENVNVYFMHGMGFVSQFCENIKFDNLKVAPKDNSGRTCSAWADILHFSGCKGNIEVLNSYLSSANDDAINVHGTHLRIIRKLSDKQIKVRFMHSQTYGFQPFFEGDNIELINSKTLLPYSKNKVVKVNKINQKEFVLDLENILPRKIKKNSVVENTTWTANLTVKNTKIEHIPTRGILVTTRGKVVLENNEFIKTTMSAILVADDAKNWYESGYVKDLTIKGNKFDKCGDPIIYIHPENGRSKGSVHKNIRIIVNEFITGDDVVLSVKNSDNIQFKNNKIISSSKQNVKDFINLKSCKDVEILNNIVVSKSLSKKIQ